MIAASEGKKKMTVVLCLQTKPTLKTDPRVGAPELITGRTMIVFKYQVGRTMVKSRQKSRTKGHPCLPKAEGASKNSTECYGAVDCSWTILKGHSQTDCDYKLFIDHESEL